MRCALTGRGMCSVICWILVAITEANAASITGRIVDSAGRPIAGAEVRVWQELHAAPRIWKQQVRFDHGDVLVTDDDGRFTSPDVLVGDAFARILAEADGMLAHRSGWIEIGKDASVAAPDIVLKRLRAVFGKVVDRQGQPIVGVTVFNSGDGHERVEATTKQSGKFFLKGVPEGAVFLFAEKPGYRFAGIRLSAEQRDAAFTLATVDEPVEPIATLPPLLSADEETAMGRRVLDPWLDSIQKSGGDAYWPLLELAKFDSAEAHNRASEMHFTEDNGRSPLEGQLFYTRIRRSDVPAWDELQTLIEVLDTEWRVGAYVAAVRRMDRTQEARRREWLAQALINARRIEEPTDRAAALANVAGALFDFGDRQRAGEIMSEAEKIAEQLRVRGGKSQWAFGLLALYQAKRDPVRAMRWLEKIKRDDVFVDFGRDLAVKLLPEHPAAAEETWKRTMDRGRRAWRIHSGERGVQLADVCYRLASLDRPRAERIARNTDEWPLRVRALGAIAFRLAESDAVGARKLLESIVRETLPHPLVDNEFEPFGYADLAAPLTAAWLLPIAERIDPQLGRECFWRSLALRPARPRRDQLNDQDMQIDIDLTMMLSRYDRRVARSLLDPLVARLPELARCGSANVDEQHARGVCTHAGSEAGTIIAAAIHVDPRWAAEVFDSTSNGDGESMRRFQSWLRDDWIGALSRHGIDRWEQEDQIFSAYFANYWRPKPEE